MRGYLLIITSGILFFIIAAVTVVHLMSARALNQQYRMHDAYQTVLDRLSIQTIVSYFVDQNIEHITLPLALSARYSLSNQAVPDGSIDFTILDQTTTRTSTFNVHVVQSQASVSLFDPANVSVSNDNVSGIRIMSPIQTHLVSLRSSWYPYHSSDVLTSVSFIDDFGDEWSVTVNATMGELITLPSPISASDRYISLNFSSLSEGGAVSIYLKYSDGSIQNAHIEY